MVKKIEKDPKEHKLPEVKVEHESLGEVVEYKPKKKTIEVEYQLTKKAMETKYVKVKLNVDDYFKTAVLEKHKHEQKQFNKLWDIMGEIVNTMKNKHTKEMVHAIFRPLTEWERNINSNWTSIVPRNMPICYTSLCKTLTDILAKVQENPKLSVKDIIELSQPKVKIKSVRELLQEEVPQVLNFSNVIFEEEQPCNNSLLAVENMPPRNEQQEILQPNQIQQIEQPPALNRNNTGKVMVLRGSGQNVGL